MRKRQDLIAAHKADDSDENYDALLMNEGEIRGMLKQLAVWRSTSMKTELERAKIRVAQWEEKE